MESGSEYRIPYPFQVTHVAPGVSMPVITSKSDGTISEDEDGTELENLNATLQSKRRTATADF